MYKQAAIIALDETIKTIEAYNLKSTGADNSIIQRAITSIKVRAITGIIIAKRLLEEPEDDSSFEIYVPEEIPEKIKTMVEEIKQTESKKPNSCPRCGFSESLPGAKYCVICGMALPSKEGPTCQK